MSACLHLLIIRHWIAVIMSVPICPDLPYIIIDIIINIVYICFTVFENGRSRPDYGFRSENDGLLWTVMTTDRWTHSIKHETIEHNKRNIFNGE